MNLLFFSSFFLLFLLFKFIHSAEKVTYRRPSDRSMRISVSNNHEVTQSVEYLSLPLEFVLKLRRVDFRRLSLDACAPFASFLIILLLLLLLYYLLFH